MFFTALACNIIEDQPPVRRAQLSKIPSDKFKAKELALFKSVRSALSFAFTIQEHSIAASSMLTPPTASKNSRLDDLTSHEKNAQGALIRRMVEQRLRGLDLALTMAYYGSGKVRNAATHRVCREVAKLVRKPGLGMELAKRHFSRNGERLSQQQIAAIYDLTQQRVSQLDTLVANEIDRLRLVAETQLVELFIRSGIADGL